LVGLEALYRIDKLKLDLYIGVVRWLCANQT
jgi:hypothetical protein